MPPLQQELVRLVRQMQLRGLSTVCLSEANRRVLGRRPAPGSPAATRPCPMPTQEQKQRAIQAFAQAQAARQNRPAPPPAVPPPPQETVPFPAPPDVREATWETLAQCCQSCQCCRLGATRKNLVLEDGHREAPLMFIGEGPGADEDAQGIPFVGRAGQLLTAMIHAMGRDRKSQDPATSVYIANVVKCRPPGNRNPTGEESAACLGYLRRQISLVRPRVIVLLGNVALMALFGRSGIIQARGVWREYQGIPVMPTFHPAFLLRHESCKADFIGLKRQVWQDLQQVMAKLREDTPPPESPVLPPPSSSC